MSTSLIDSTDAADRDLQQRVSSYLATRHFPVFSGLIVSVQGGAVTISGRVHSFYERQVAISSCQRVAGVINLIDNIRVDRAK